MLLEPLSWLGYVAGFVCLAFAIASGLYVVSEYVEEHTVFTRKLIVRYIQVILGVHVLLWLLDGLSFWRTAFSVAVNIIYLDIMKQFPLVDLSSASFILACAGAVINYWLWFRYFSNPDLPPYSIYESIPTFRGETLPPFRQIASFFGLLIWAVPFLLLVSLSAGDNVLPTVSDEGSNAKRRRGLFKAVADRVLAYIKPKKESSVLG